MNQMKIGSFLQKLRKEKGLTQEQLAEMTGVARRTVSRWETGYNMPDLDILIILSDLYEVDLRELLDGERKDKSMDRDLEETVIKVAQYSSDVQKRSARVTLVYFIIGIMALIANGVMNIMEIGGTFWIGFLKGMTFAWAAAAMVLGILYVTGLMAKVQAFKMRLFKRDGEGK